MILYFIIKITTIQNQQATQIMLQAGHVNYNSSPHMVPPPILGTLHPSNVANINGRIISRSPTAYHMQDQRNLSPNKLNATKKPMIGQNNINYNIPANFTSRSRNSPSPNTKATNLLGNNFLTNGNQNFNSNINFNANGRQPLLNSNGYSPRNIEQQIYNNNFRQKVISCQNHINKPAQFFAQTQSQDIGYCQKCAINLISKGFPVSRRQGRIQQNRNFQVPRHNILQQHRLQPFQIPQYMGVPQYMQVQKFITQIDEIHSRYLNQIYKYQNMDRHYEHQYQITQHFYQSLLDLVHQMKNDHLADLKNQSKKHAQIALIKQDLLKMDLQPIQIIRRDLIENIQVILEGFHNDIIQQNFTLYRQAMFKFKDKIQDQNAEFNREIINEKQPELKKRLKKIQQYLLNVWNDKQQVQNKPQNIIRNIPKTDLKHFVDPKYLQGQDKSTKTVKQIINMNARIQADSKKQRQTTAYRKLFQDDNDNIQQNKRKENLFLHNANQFNDPEELTGQKSPQFKNI